MPKYINADQFERDCVFDKKCEDMQDVIYKLRDYPSADVVEIVRCRDCKYFCKVHKKTKWGACDNDAGLVVTFPYSFCSYGERKDAE